MVDEDLFRDDIIKTKKVELDHLLANEKMIEKIDFNEVSR